MITANNMIPVGFELGESNFETQLMAALALQTRKYNTSVSLKANVYSLAPAIIKDAVLSSGCEITQVCPVPNVIKNTRIQMNNGCKICLLTDISDGQEVIYGLDKNDPVPTAALEADYQRTQAISLSFSLLKTYWLGNKLYVAADLKNPLLLPNYTKDDGQWKKILENTPPTVVITENAGANAVAQKVSYDNALLYIDKMIDAQSVSLGMVMNSEKFIWSTVEMFDVVQAQRAKNELAGIRFVQIENEFGNFDAYNYRDVTVIKYEHFSNAIKDLAAPVGTVKLPNRMILTIGLPMLSFPLPGENTFKSDFNEATRLYTPTTIGTILHPEAVSGDYYVVAY